jgi:hypothetical protein
MMPLKDLVEDNPVEKSAQPQPKEDTRHSRKTSSILCVCSIHTATSSDP